MNPREVKTPVPWRVIAISTGIGLLLLAGILAAIWMSMVGIQDAKMTGIVVEKQFVPAPERQVGLDREGRLRSETLDGEYIILVNVRQKDGSSKSYKVWLNSKQRYEAVKEGDKFDVGPYLIRD